MYEPQPTKDSNQSEFSVAELSRSLKRAVESQFSHVKVKGELSSFKQATSGHAYMTLKDASASDVLDAVCWRGTMARLQFRPQEGMEVVATGKVTTYGDRSKYQLVIEGLEIAGQGTLLQQFEALKQKLQQEGLFDAAKKRPLPSLPSRIGVITSPTGAVIRDILHRLEDRFPSHVLVWPSLVQGEQAPMQLVEAIMGMNALPEQDESLQETPSDIPIRPDLLIIARGGGALEDLWAFNDEQVVRAVAESQIPVISAVGHETDFTLCDFVADMRAPTPTAAAEMAVPVRRDLLTSLNEGAMRLSRAAKRLLSHKQALHEGWAAALPSLDRILDYAEQRVDDRFERLSLAARGLSRQKVQFFRQLEARLRSPNQLLQQAEQTFSRLDQRFSHRLATSIAPHHAHLDNLQERLEANSFKSVLQRGYAVITTQDGALVKDGKSLKSDQSLTARFRDDHHAEITVKRITPIKSS